MKRDAKPALLNTVSPLLRGGLGESGRLERLELAEECAAASLGTLDWEGWTGGVGTIFLLLVWDWELWESVREE